MPDDRAALHLKNANFRVRRPSWGSAVALLAACLVWGCGPSIHDGGPEATSTEPVLEEPSQPLPASPVPSTVGIGCGLFPEDHIWNVPVTGLPVDPDSDAYIRSIGDTVGMHPDFGSGLWEGGPIGIPYTEVDRATPRSQVAFDYVDESDPGPYPIPPLPPIEGGPESDGDRHILLWDRGGCRLYELYAAYPQSDGSWQAGSGAIYDLAGYDLRPESWTSADAAGLPILPGLVRYEEVAAGEIRHALRFTAPDTRRAYVWPARHFASDREELRLPAMGQRFRLRPDVDLASFSPEVQVILRALQIYGMMLADNGKAWYLNGAPDERWDNDALHEMDRIQGWQFEVVDVSSLQIEPNSGRTR